MAPPEVGVHAARVPFGAMGAGGAMDPTIPLAPVRAFAAPPHVDDAVALLTAAPLDAVAYGFTSSAYVIGADGETAMLERLAARAGGVPVVAPCAATVEALRLLSADRIALFDPPWFDTELDDLGRAYYEAAGFEVVAAMPCDLPSAQASIEPSAMRDAIATNVPDGADAVVIGGNGFRAVGVIDELEDRLARPVISANQVLLWAALRASGTRSSQVTGYGRLFDLSAATAGGRETRATAP
jgi:maleate isomerase